MAKKPNRFGSPFDPFNFGKVPQEQQPPRMREEEKKPVQLGPGCGNPQCPACYPELNGAARTLGIGGRNGMAIGGNPFRSSSGGRPEISVKRIAMPDGSFRDIPIRTGFDAPPEEIQMRDAYERLMREMQERGLMRRPEESIFRIDYGLSDRLYEPPRPTPPPPRQPPQSYKDAREQVEDFIVKADDQAFEDIVGNEAALESLIDAVQAPVKYKEVYEAYGMKMPKGALLSGPPGCGKTMFARAAATEFRKLYGAEHVEFLSIQSTDIESMFVGVTEAHIRNIFTFGREYKAYHGHPLLVFIDEAEILFPDRTGRIRRVTPWEESRVATFLAEMDGVRESGVFLLLATNRPEVVDSALLRDGRCDFKIVIERPTKDSAEKILQKNFASTFAKDERETLVMTALESFYSPNFIIAEAGSIVADFEKREVKLGLSRHFLLEDIVSGAMLASIPGRATRYAFARDKTEGVAHGVTIDDVIRAVQDLFEENKRLDHPYAQREFMEKFQEDVQKEQEK